MFKHKKHSPFSLGDAKALRVQTRRKRVYRNTLLLVLGLSGLTAAAEVANRATGPASLENATPDKA